VNYRNSEEFMKEIGCLCTKQALIQLKKFDRGAFEDFLIDGRGG
jgi:hypothetical protein